MLLHIFYVLLRKNRKGKYKVLNTKMNLYYTKNLSIFDFILSILKLALDI